MEIVGQMLTQIFTQFNIQILFQFIAGYKGVVMLMLIGYVLHFIPRDVEVAFQERLTSLPFVYKAAWMIVIIILVMQTKSAGVQPFIYFQF